MCSSDLFFCIIGKNGSGKSTLCDSLVGLIPHYFAGRMSGKVIIYGKETTDMTIGEISSTVGFVFQNPFNQLSYTTGSVEEELAYGLCNMGISRKEMKEKVGRIAKLVRVDHLLNKSPLELSGGQVQRVALGSSLIMEPKVLVLDECTTQLDPLGSEEIFDIVKELNKSGVTVIMVDHDMERVARCADRILVLNEGKKIALEKPEVIFNDNNVISNGVQAPDFVNIGNALKREGLYNGTIIIDENVAVKAVREALTA